MGSFWSSSNPNTIGDLRGKVALVTGANTGLGYIIAEQLALHGAKVYIGARSEAKAKEALQKYAREHAGKEKKGEMLWLQLDLTSPTDVAEAVKRFLAAENRLDILVNNAARLPSPYVLTKDGIEMSVAVNHLGHFALYRGLFPLIKHTSTLPNSDIRIVTQTSLAHAQLGQYEKICTRLQDKSDFNITPHSSKNSEVDSFRGNGGRYCYTKLLNVLFANELQRRANAENVPLISISVHPGVASTEGALDLLPWFLKPLIRILVSTPLQGAYPAIFAATAEEVREKREEYMGAYLGPNGKRRSPAKVAMDEEVAQRLWELSEDVVGEILGEKK